MKEYPPADITDEALMRRFQSVRDETALRTLMDRHLGAALAVADARLRNTGLSDDAVQEAFVRVARHADRYNPDRPFAPWFYSILRHICTDLIRKECRYRNQLKSFADREDISPSRTADFGPLYAALDRLREDEQELLILRMVRGLSFREIAESFGCSEEAAKKRGARAIRRLRSSMKKSKDVVPCPPPAYVTCIADAIPSALKKDYELSSI